MQPKVTGQSFGGRLAKALTAAGIPADKKRLQRVSTMFSVSREAVRKWLADEAIPQTKRIELIATRLGVNGEWLLTGSGLMCRAANIDEIAETAVGYRITDLDIDERGLLDDYRQMAPERRTAFRLIAAALAGSDESPHLSCHR